MGSNNTPWPEERTDALKQYWGQGLSCSNIADLLGISRCAVAGKAHRLELPGRSKERRPYGPRIPRQYRPRSIRKSGRKEARVVHGQFGSRHVLEFIDVGTDLAPSLPDKPRSIFELDKHECRWPCEGGGYQTVFCGGECITDHAYCGRHFRIAYRGLR